MRAISGSTSCEQAGFVEQLEGAAGVALGEHLGQLVANALAADGVNARRERADGGESGGFDLEPEARGKAHGAQQAQLVFFEALLGVADGADDAGIEIGEAADVVEYGGAQVLGSARSLVQGLPARSGSRRRPLMVKSRRCTSSAALVV